MFHESGKGKSIGEPHHPLPGYAIKKLKCLTYVRSGLTGLAYALRHILPLHLMCDFKDIEVHSDPQSALFEQKPAIIIFDAIPGGIGLSQMSYDKIITIVAHSSYLYCRMSSAGRMPKLYRTRR